MAEGDRRGLTALPQSAEWQRLFTHFQLILAAHAYPTKLSQRASAAATNNEHHIETVWGLGYVLRDAPAISQAAAA